MSHLPASGPTRALADLAFGSQTHVIDTSRPLAWLSPEELAIDLNDPVQRRFGDYELIEAIGQGGMGVVYRARQHGLERDVAIKLLAAGPWASAEFIERFRREARSAARMQHPNIVEIYEFGHRDGLNYFSMRLIDGQSLAEQLLADGAMPPKDAAKLLRTLAEAMDYAHRLGVLHLDLKPANVLLTKSGEPLIADFGLARRIDAGHEGGSEISGTPSYMAPEQAQLESHPLSASTDIYGLGAILYECLTGRPPFLGGNAQSTLERVIAEAPEAPRQISKAIPADLEAICLKCLEKDPNQRYTSARELAEDLRRFTEDEPVSVRRLSGFQRATRWARREPRLAALTGLLVLALAAGIVGKELQQRVNAEADIERAVHAAEVMAALTEVNPEDPSSGTGALGEVVGWANTTSGITGDGEENTRRIQDAFVTALMRSGHPGKLSVAREAIFWDLLSQDAETSASLSDLSRQLRATGLTADLWAAWTLRSNDSKSFRDELLNRVGTPASTPETDMMIALAACDGSFTTTDCTRVRQFLTRTDPDNAFVWLIASPDSRRDRRKALEHLHRAATSARFDDYNWRRAALFSERLRRGQWLPPSRLVRYQQELFPGTPAIELLLLAQLPVQQSFLHDSVWKLCDPGKTPPGETTPVQDCLALAGLVMRGRSSIHARRLLGQYVYRRLAPGSEQARAAEAERPVDLWLYLGRERAALGDLASNAQAIDQYIRDYEEAGEWEAVLRQFDRAGIARSPAHRFTQTPDFSERLLLPEQRRAAQ